VTDPWLRSLMDLECFVLSGMLAQDTLTAGARQAQLTSGPLTTLHGCQGTTASDPGPASGM